MPTLYSLVSSTEAPAEEAEAELEAVPDLEALEALQDPVEFNADSKATQILGDEIVRPSRKGTAGKYTAGDGTLRRVTAMIEVRGQMRRMVFFTNNRDWSARTVAELYRARWAVELFFKELKQTCQLRDFVGYNENAVKWQIWTGLLVHLLLRVPLWLAKMLVETTMFFVNYALQTRLVFRKKKKAVSGPELSGGEEG